MRWHAEHLQEDGKINHPADAKAWKRFNDRHPDFASEVLNLRLGLCTDGFSPLREGFIVQAYLREEVGNFMSHYFESHVVTRRRKVPRNDDVGDNDGVPRSTISIFSNDGRASRSLVKRYLTEKEWVAAHLYILLNTDKLIQFHK
ncbi:hypothetical protein Dimus_038419 [Dionaea muscipula]